MSNKRSQDHESEILVAEKDIKNKFEILRTSRIIKPINTQQPAKTTLNDTKLISNILEDLINKKIETIVPIIDTLKFKFNSIEVDSLNLKKGIKKTRLK